MVFNKKAISPVVATALLLVVAVVAVVGFQTWFNTYQSGLNTKVEQQSATGTAVTVERLETTNGLYLKNSNKANNVTISSISIAGATIQGCTNIQLAPGVANIASVSSCNVTGLTQGDSVDVVVVTKDGVFQENEIVR